MLKDLLRESIVIIVGKPAESIAELLHNKRHQNEFLIAKKLGFTINQTRNLLYRIADHGLVLSIRKKDKKKGWYTYFWKLDVLKTLEFLRAFLLKRKSQFENQINSRESKQFYICENCNIEFTEENALLRDFTCPECGGVFALKDNTKVLRGLNRNLNRYNKKLEEVESEIAKEQEKLEKAKEKELKKIAKDKAEKRKANAKKAAQKRASAKKKTAKKKVKKPVKKAVKKSVKKATKKVVKKKSSKKTSKTKKSKKK